MQIGPGLHEASRVFMIITINTFFFIKAFPGLLVKWRRLLAYTLGLTRRIYYFILKVYEHSR